MKGAVSLGKAEDAEIVYPLDCRRDLVVFPDVDGRIGDLALETRGRRESERNVMVYVE